VPQRFGVRHQQQVRRMSDLDSNTKITVAEAGTGQVAEEWNLCKLTSENGWPSCSACTFCRFVLNNCCASSCTFDCFQPA
jgi:hypothetical protein